MGLLNTILGLFAGGATGGGIPADKQDYVGDWRAEGMDLSIATDGQVRLRQIVTTETAEGTNTRTRNVSGPIARWDGDSFEVGLMGNNQRFQVDAPPAGNQMTVDGIVLTRSV